MSRGVPPNPIQFRNLQQWAEQLYAYMLNRSPNTEEADPQPVLLAHRSDAVLERASIDGIMMFDQKYETPVVSEQGFWEPTRGVPAFSLNYDEAAATNGATLSIGANKIPFDTAEVALAPWATFNVTTNDFDLWQGCYYIEGFVSLSKVAGNQKGFTGYLAESSDLTTAVGTVRMGSLFIPASGDNGVTHVVPFRGQVEVPSGGGTYAMVVNTPQADSRFGTAHNVTGFDNIYARLTVSLIGLNE